MALHLCSLSVPRPQEEGAGQAARPPGRVSSVQYLQ